MYKITTFNSVSDTKRPISPYGDNTFDFITLETESEMQLVHTLANNYCLNIPIDIKSKVRLRRKKEFLKDHIPQRLNYIILDLDDIDTLEKQSKVIEYFKKFKCILIASRSCNFIDNFRLKGFLFCDIETRFIKGILGFLHDELIDFCSVDEKPSCISTFNAPTNKVEILLDNLQCTKQLTIDDVDIVLKYQTPKEVRLNSISNYDDAKTIEDLCLKVFQDMGFKALGANENCLVFSHPNEVKTPGGYFWFSNSPYRMNHFNASKSISIYEDVKKLPIFKSLVSKPLDYNELFKNDFSNYKILKVNQKILKIDENLKNEIENFINGDCDTFCIRSAMGTGKSNIISYVIQEAQSQDMRILVITNRISVAEDFSSKYNLKVYNKDKYQIGDSIICQYDSLWKYNIKQFDIIILDEFISLLLHSRNNLGNSPINYAKFFATFNKKILIADAFITGYEQKLVMKKGNALMLDNEFKDDANLMLYENFNFFVQMILKKAKETKITVSCTSLNIIKALQLLLVKHGVRVVTLTSETPLVSKQLVYKHFDKSENDLWDCLIFSPTLTVGVSNMNNVSNHFHYDSAMSCDVISSIQMIKRTRKAKNVHLFLKNRFNPLKTKYEDLRDSYLNEIGKYAENNFMFELNDFGEPRVSKVGKRAILIDVFRNILEVNHKDALLYLLKYHFKNDPKIISNSLYTNILLKYQKQSKENEKLIFTEQLKQFSLLTDISLNTLDTDYNNKSFFNKLSTINDEIDCDDVKTREEIIKACFNDSNLIKNCKLYKIALNYFNGIYSKDFIKSKISNLLIKNDLNTIDFCSKLLRLDQKPLKEKYLMKDVSKELNIILKKCGYTFKQNNIENGIIFFRADKDVLKYYEYIKI